MRRFDILINQVRRATETIQFSDDTGVSDEEFIQYGNDAQDRILSLIQGVNPDILLAEKIISINANQESVPIPSDLYMNTRISNVEFLQGGRTQYYRLIQGQLAERLSGVTGIPSFYIRRSNELLIEPPPGGGGILRITYQQKIPTVDIRRGQVSSVSLSSNSINSLALSTSATLDSTTLNDYGFLTVGSNVGLVKMKSIPISNVDPSTGVVSVNTFNFEDGETIEIGDYVCAGENATTHSLLPDVCERYLLQYMVWKILKRDSSNDHAEALTELQMIEEDIVSAFSVADTDLDVVPIINTEYLSLNF